jgi:hypothetical protein
VIGSGSSFVKSEENSLGRFLRCSGALGIRVRFLGASSGIACCDLILAEKLIQEDGARRRVNAVLAVMRCYVLQSCSAASAVWCKCSEAVRAAR